MSAALVPYGDESIPCRIERLADGQTLVTITHQGRTITQPIETFRAAGLQINFNEADLKPPSDNVEYTVEEVARARRGWWWVKVGVFWFVLGTLLRCFA